MTRGGQVSRVHHESCVLVRTLTAAVKSCMEDILGRLKSVANNIPLHARTLIVESAFYDVVPPSVAVRRHGKHTLRFMWGFGAADCSLRSQDAHIHDSKVVGVC